LSISSTQREIRLLRGEVHAVIVVPQRAQRFVDVAVRCMVGVEARQHVGIVLIAEVSRGIEVARVPSLSDGLCALCRCVDTEGIPKPVLLT